MLNAQPGAFTLTGADATFTRGLSLNAEPGAYVVSGADATFALTASTASTGGAGWYGKPNYLKWEERQNLRNKKKLPPKAPKLPQPPAQVQESLQAAIQKGRELSAIDAEIQLLMELSLAERRRLDEEDAIALLLLAA